MKEQVGLNQLTLEDIILCYEFGIRFDLNDGSITKILDKIGEE